MIASRLHTTVEFLKSGSDDSSNILEFLELAHSQYDSKKFSECLISINCAEVFQFCDPTLIGRIKLLHGQTLVALKRNQESLSYFEESIRLFDPSTDRELFVNATFELANSYYRLENFRNSIFYYRRVIKYSSNRKRLFLIYVRSYVYLGSSLFKTGNHSESIAAYQQGFNEAKAINDFKIQIDTLVGLGGVYWQLQNINDAIKFTQQALTISQKSEGYMWTEINQNLGIFFKEKGITSKARRMLLNCLDWYEKHDNTLGQIAIREELAELFIMASDYNAAQLELSKALELLDVQENYILHGRIYRLTANLHQSKGENEYAEHFCHLAIGYFKLANAKAEIELTLAQFIR